MSDSGKVFSIIDNYILTYDSQIACNSQIACEEVKNQWVRTRKEILEKIKIAKHGFVTDIEGNKICRPYRLHLDPIIQIGPQYQAFQYWCKVYCIWIKKMIGRLKLEPNVMIALGKAEHLSREFYHILSEHGILMRQGNLVLKKIVKDYILTDFEFVNTNHHPDFDPSSMEAIIIEDFIGTGRSIMIAKRKIEAMGGKVVGIISFTNAYGDSWSFGVPLNMTFLNIDYTKYPAGTCPVCTGQTNHLID